MNWTADDHPPAAKLDGPDCFCNPKMEIRDLDPSDMEMAMPYMYEVQYIKPVQPERARGEGRREREVWWTDQFIPSGQLRSRVTRVKKHLRRCL
ncbi:Hypothetical predicted protein [Olea europaea subsp. europaea]|uniref:Uncharacterized protein n=1 Tax=Olea europaea subsp. europaea TaxID=158383 RepID=A0A8S0RQ44_OLEEU|nr:Hypothetical predicted protein [Olea europaea subsp. europaea]